MEWLELQEGLQGDDVSDHFGRLSRFLRILHWFQEYRAWVIAIITLGTLITAFTCFVIFSVHHSTGEWIDEDGVNAYYFYERNRTTFKNDMLYIEQYATAVRP
ncbi:hypothetical protein BIW11_07026 [Tropilaelaps mercedesae]|uniref:Uncharacterized protein n=1 Tax=Tropilaelaps mercedesae TaxID=418985 RepID=A0A1V9XVU3_9ACAR|nr:hypothetical protein BIW11_07026 [Tropilaelaps mercedesae]